MTATGDLKQVEAISICVSSGLVGLKRGGLSKEGLVFLFLRDLSGSAKSIESRGKYKTRHTFKNQITTIQHSLNVCLT